MKAAAVFNAACFSAHVVPWLGAAGAATGSLRPEALVLNREKRPCRSLRWPLYDFADDSPPVGVDADVAVGERAGGGGGGAADFPPIPKPGTETPAAPRRLMAPWLK